MWDGKDRPGACPSSPLAPGWTRMQVRLSPKAREEEERLMAGQFASGDTGMGEGAAARPCAPVGARI